MADPSRHQVPHASNRIARLRAQPQPIPPQPIPAQHSGTRSNPIPLGRGIGSVLTLLRSSGSAVTRLSFETRSDSASKEKIHFNNRYYIIILSDLIEFSPPPSSIFSPIQFDPHIVSASRPFSPLSIRKRMPSAFPPRPRKLA